MNSYMDRTNPNLVIVLHFISKTLWLGLAALFGLVGYKLYALGVQQTGDMEFGIPGVLSFKASAAGPGLVVMIFALACALTGVIRAKVEIGPDIITMRAPPPGPAKKIDHTLSASECKLFSSLLHYLTEEPGAFALLNSSAEVDIESMAWSAVPQDLREQAIGAGSKLVSSAGRPNQWSGVIQGWKLRCKTIAIIEPEQTWCVISAAPSEAESQVRVAREDARPIFG